MSLKTKKEPKIHKEAEASSIKIFMCVDIWAAWKPKFTAVSFRCARRSSTPQRGQRRFRRNFFFSSSERLFPARLAFDVAVALQFSSARKSSGKREKRAEARRASRVEREEKLSCFPFLSAFWIISVIVQRGLTHLYNCNASFFCWLWRYRCWCTGWFNGHEKKNSWKHTENYVECSLVSCLPCFREFECVNCRLPSISLF